MNINEYVSNTIIHYSKSIEELQKEHHDRVVSLKRKVHHLKSQLNKHSIYECTVCLDYEELQYMLHCEQCNEPYCAKCVFRCRECVCYFCENCQKTWSCSRMSDACKNCLGGGGNKMIVCVWCDAEKCRCDIIINE